ncbi:concanavalin A-like lectin/glucanase domain-containing protein [Lasiosphaeria miniovina]|uniref:Concanavalin A-like lectin/glucanase domain-containing protein n=1 Tax=Lasiosphaeria miniovina TaxID=1954250 RepID=A0AA39ZUX9_9PEZI|nr:concanavalin A-like lectin/glucanase domain-containing protein [Lasiosphaeria miniovina]KAK0703990.1 concanavalin A-like lectin/glucanase domain-containing protein [Lasiosphaeria miniovina]
MSNTLDACVPAPVCKDKTYTWDNNTFHDYYKDIGSYLGDSSKVDWVGQGEPIPFEGNVLLTMPEHSVGTVLATTTYMWYGSVKAKLKTSRDAGVVTAFILLSDVKDEIDYEFVGTELDTAQTNYYFQGIPDYDNSGNITGLSNTYDNFHEYEIQWTPDTITWLVDGKVGRVKKKSETYNATARQWNYPQTPSRVQISIWPGGLDTNAKGTIDWAGGPIDWNSQEIKDYGYYFATFGEIDVKCYNANSPPGTNKKTSYYYNDASATNNTVVDSDKPTVLKSFLGSGTDMNAGSSTASGSASQPSNSNVNTVPGGSSTPAQVPGGNSGSSSESSSNGGDSSSSSNSGNSGGTSNSGSNSNCPSTGFSQSCGSSSTNPKNDGVRVVERSLGGSALAGIIGFAWLLLL